MASGQTLTTFSPLMVEPPSSNYAILDKDGDQWVLDFDGSTNETAKFRAIMPNNYAGGGVTVYLWYLTASTSGDVDWDVAFENCNGLDISTDGFAAVNSVDGNTASSELQSTSVAFTDGADMDSVTAGDPFRLKVTRDAASDAHNGDAKLWGIEVRET